MKEEAKKQKWRRLNGVVPGAVLSFYPSDRPDPKTNILGCSLAPPSKRAQSEIDSSLLSRTVKANTCKLLNGKAARCYTHAASKIVLAARYNSFLSASSTTIVVIDAGRNVSS